jgi:hypothetical protein
LAFDHWRRKRRRMIKHQSQRSELLSDVGKNEQKNKTKTIFTARLDKLGFIEAPLSYKWHVEEGGRPRA